MLASLSIASRKLSLLPQMPWWQTVIISILQMRCRDLPHSSKWEIGPLDHHIFSLSGTSAHPLSQVATASGLPCGSDGKESACHAGDLGSIPGSERCPGEGNGNPLQHSCLENPMDRGAWWATVHGVAKRHDRVTNTLIFHYSVQQRALADWLGRSLEKGVSPGVCSLPSH